MSLLARPFLDLIWHTPTLRRGAVICVALALVASVAEIAVAMSLVPILASLGVAAGTEFSEFVNRVPPWAWLLLFVITAVLRSAVSWFSSVQSQRSTQELVVLLQSRLYRALATAHWDAIRRLSPPNITNALHTQTYAAGYGFRSMVQVATATFLVIGYTISTIVVFPPMFLVLLAVLALMWWLNVRRSNRVLGLSENYRDVQSEQYQRYEDWVAISRISSLGVDSGRLADRFEAGAREAASHAVGFSKSSAGTRISYEAAVVTAILVGVPIAWWLETPPALLAFGIVVFVRMLPRAGGIQVGYQGVVSAVAPVQAVDRLATQLELDPIVRPPEQSALTWKQLRLTGVGIEDTVRDESRHWILRNIDLELNHGEWLALTGPTGAGKTTLADAMLMLVRADAGEMSIDDRAVDEALASLWRDQAAYVPQDVVLFDASIRDNLRLYVPDATDDELVAALEQAAADFVVDRLPEKLDTRAGPGGRWLSGGERQRIGIARALLRKPGFLVLDEPTAALDTGPQSKLMEALSKLEHTMSVVLITHRPKLISLADRVIEMEDGRITR